ncbi:DUF917 domain-containing protein [Fundicoccus culcitae]|uniref:DUF917 domain-containing protein n=1 Tax=Fundicoccus culcitae TaxID=2969821 RepID=A0ABY5P448_9LACT|nr:DUF917 domain-containing protein [Fundicoccus culcitae]UUX33519.1 DUF917 domain-containing protein [Fundicoccus culcitae]
MRYIGVEEIEKIALGATLLGTGGGGDPTIGTLISKQAIEQYGPVQLLSIDEVDDKLLVASPSGIGAPTVSVEKIPDIESHERALEIIEDYLDVRVDALFPIEAGGSNSLVPFPIAAKRGIPVIDADGMGRAFPEVQMVTFYLDGLQGMPMGIADMQGNVALINGMSAVEGEKIARSITTTFGGTASDASYVMTADKLKQSGVIGTLTLSEQIGEILLTADKPIPALLKLLNAFLLFKGKVFDVSRKTEGGFVRGFTQLTGLDEYEDETAEMSFQNENLIFKRNEDVICMTPDLICVLDLETGMPVTTERVKFGIRVAVIGIPCDPKWRVPKGIEVVGPRYFGYDMDYVEVENLNKEDLHEINWER